MLSVSLSQGFRANEAHPWVGGVFSFKRGWGRTPRSWWCQESCCKCKRGRIYWEFRGISQNVKTGGWIFSVSQNSSKTTKCWFIDQTWGSKSMIRAMKSLSETIPKRWTSILSAIRVSHGVHQRWSVALPTSLLSVPKYLPNASPQVWRGLALNKKKRCQFFKCGWNKLSASFSKNYSRSSVIGWAKYVYSSIDFPYQTITRFLRVSTLIISLLDFGLFKLVLLFRLSPAPT